MRTTNSLQTHPLSAPGVARHTTKRRVRRARLWLALIIICGTLGLWQYAAQVQVVPAYVLPPPGAVAAKWLDLWNTGTLAVHIGATLQEALLGFLVAFVVGIVLGYPLGKSPLVASVVAPYIAAIQALPIIAVAPILVVWFGLGLPPKIIICVLVVFFPILVNTSIGIQSVDSDLIDAAKAQGANWWKVLRYIEIPLALRTLLGGVKLGLSLAMTGAIVSEFVAADAGLGYLMTLARSNYDAPMLYVAALTMASVTLLGYAAITLFEYFYIDW